MQKPVIDPYNMVVVFYILTINPNGRYDIVKDNNEIKITNDPAK